MKTKKPKTAYDRLASVAKHIVEDPKRYYQGVWIVKRKRDIREHMGDVPVCGTIACLAGWIVVLQDGMHAKAVRAEIRQKSTHPDDVYIPHVRNRANAILGMSSEDTIALFGAFPWADPPKHKPGTIGYARLGAKGIREFMAKHKSHLKARLLKDVPK